ncbi:hypothetical protein [Arthrobacter sp. A5]|uniref:hypothetical protein n=1 Tax=Arthrobacter sp. A5 TaxID=576926 RepID=UPI003DA87066
MSPVSRRRKPAKKNKSKASNSPLSALVRRYAPIFNSFSAGPETYDVLDPWLLASALHDDLIGPDHAAGLDPRQLEKLMSTAGRLKLPGSGTMLLTLALLQGATETTRELLSVGVHLSIEIGHERELDSALLTPELVSAVELKDVFDEQSSFLLTLRAADFEYGILLHTAREAYGDAATGGGVTAAPQATALDLQAVVSAEPGLWEFAEIPVDDAGGLMLDAMETTDSVPEASDDPHYWQARQLVMTILENALEDTDPDLWDDDEATWAALAGEQAGNQTGDQPAGTAGDQTRDPAGNPAAPAVNSALKADLALDPVAGEKLRTHLADLEATARGALAQAGGAVIQRFINSSDGTQSGAAATNPEAWLALANHWTNYSISYDYSSFMRVGPLKLDTFVSWYLRREVTLSQAQRQELPAFLRGWVRWCADTASLAEPARAKLVSTLDELLPLP